MKRCLLYIFTGFALLFVYVKPASAAVLRVPQDYTSIETAYNAANNADEIVVSPGTYIVCLSGNRNKRIVLRAQFPATTSPTNQHSIINSNCSHVIQFSTPLDSDGIFQPGDHVEFVGFVLNGNQIQGVSSGTDDGFSYESASGIVKDNIIYGTTDDPVDIDGASEAHVIGNILKDGRGGGDGLENRLHSFSSSRDLKIIFRNNIFYNHNNDGIHLIGIISGLTKRKYLIANNLIINNTQAGLGTTGNAVSDQAQFPGGYPLPEKIYVINNTFVENGMGGILGGANMVVHNNIFYNNSVVDLKNVSGNSVASHNLFFGPAVDYEGSNVQSPNVTADPNFINTSLPPNFESFQLGAASPAVDAGMVVNNIYTEFGVTPPGYSENAPDLGWKESGSTPPSSSPTPTPGQFTIADLKSLLAGYLGPQNQSYFPLDGKINMLDAGFVMSRL